jgi:hypothetical protein
MNVFVLSRSYNATNIFQQSSKHFKIGGIENAKTLYLRMIYFDTGYRFFYKSLYDFNKVNDELL